MKKKYKSVAVFLLIAYASFCVLLGVGVTFNTLRLSGSLSLVLPITIFPFTMLVTIVFVKFKYYNLSKFLTSILPAYFILLASIYLKIHGIFNNQLLYILPRIFVILSLMPPVIFFGLKHWRKMLLSLIILIPPVLLFDTLHNYFGLHIEEMPYDHSFYTFFKLIFITVYFIPLLSVLFFQRVGMLFKKELTKKNEKIVEEKDKVLELNQQLKFQANLYSILNIISKNESLEVILQKVLNNLLSIDALEIQQKGLIFLKDSNEDLNMIVQKNCNELETFCNKIKPGQCLCGQALLQKKNIFCDNIDHNHTIKPEGMLPHGHYVVPIFNHEEVIGIINIYIKEGSKKDNNIVKYLEAIADVLARKIISEERKFTLEEKNNEIKMHRDTLDSMYTELTDSLDYAKLLQESLLPNQDTLSNCFRESAILFSPKDRVSGDFYFAHKGEKCVYFGVGDCTGHGIPGAFLAAMSIEAVNTVLHENICKKPDVILNKLRKVAKNRFDTNENGQRSDSMDAGVCAYLKDEELLYYAGGFINLMIVRNGQVLEYMADRCPVGVYPIEKPFTLHKIKLQKNDVIYLISDGYNDQFGCEEHDKKIRPRKFLKKRFKELVLGINHLPCGDQVVKLRNNLEKWKGNEAQIDDVTVFVVRH